jgi:hypothetical protein
MLMERTNVERWIVLAAAVEAIATSLVLLISPSLFAWLVLGAELSETGEALGRLTGIVLLSFGLACWPASAAVKQSAKVNRALTIYNALATIYLVYLGVGGKLIGILLWPAVVLHVVLTMLVGRVWRAGGQSAHRVTGA